MGSVHAVHNRQISRYCHVDQVPAIVAVVGRRATHYHGDLQARSIRNFVKSVIPSWVVEEVCGVGGTGLGVLNWNRY